MLNKLVPGIEIGKNAHLVGNFSSEKELFLLFSRFAQQLRSLPFYFDRKDQPQQPQQPQLAESQQDEPRAAELPVGEPQRVEVSSLSSRVLEAGEELPDQLFFALVLLEREAKNEAYGTTSVRVVEELVKLLKDRDLDTLQHTYRTLFGRIVEPGEDIRRALKMIESYFREAGAGAGAGAEAAAPEA